MSDVNQLGLTKEEALALGHKRGLVTSGVWTVEQARRWLAEERPAFDPERWGADPASDYEDADDLVTAVKCTAVAANWRMPDEQSIRDWYAAETERES